MAKTSASVFSAIAAVACLSFNPETSAQLSRSQPSVLGFEIGKATVREVLAVRGPAAGAFLAGQDREFPHADSSDPLVLRYESQFELTRAFPAQVFFYFDATSNALSAVTVSFSGHDSELPLSREVIEVYGEAFRQVHRHWILDSGGTEAILGDCDHPSGGVESWVYREVGLEVFIESSVAEGKRVSGLRFSKNLWAGTEVYPPCGDAPVPDQTIPPNMR